jgi:glycosyl transferase family 25
MSVHLHEMNVPFERLDAVDGIACSTEDLAYLPEHGPIGKLSTRTRACTASHLKAMRTFLAGPSNFALILEDDVEILPDLTELVAKDDWLGGQADIVKLEKFNPKHPSKLIVGPILGSTPDEKSVFRAMYSRHTGGAGYIISRRGAEIALSFECQIDIPIDHFLFNETVSPLFKKLRPAILVQPILWQSASIGFESSIAGMTQDETSRVARKLRSLRRGFFDMRLIFWQLFLLMTGQAEVVTIYTPVSEGSSPPKILRRFLRP